MNTALLRFTLLLGASLGLMSCNDDYPIGPRPHSTPGAGRNLVLPPGITEVRVLDQNWSDEEAARYYNLNQGSQMVPYEWFLRFEQADSTTPFRDAANFFKYGYLPRSPGSGNPDGLPVGFAKSGIHVGLTCAACHTGIVTIKNTAYIIDGGQTMADATGLMRALEATMQATLADDGKFNRFATAVLKSEAGDAAKTADLKKDLARVTKERADYNKRNFPAVAAHAFGPGRIDAFGAILNEAAVRFAQAKDVETRVDAPVSYPFLWDTPQHDKVQWNGSVSNTESPIEFRGTKHIGALGRNVGEVLGVFGDVDTTEATGLFTGYKSSVNMANLIKLEDLVRTLWSPQWPEEQGKDDEAYRIKEDLKVAGAKLYEQHCIKCHALLPDLKNPNRRIKAEMRVVDTDETMARNIIERESSSGVFEGRKLVQKEFPFIRSLGPTEHVETLLSHLGYNVLIGGPLLPAEETAAIQFQYEAHVQVQDGDQRLSLTLVNAQASHGRLLKGIVKARELEVAGQKISLPANDVSLMSPKVARALNMEVLSPKLARNFEMTFGSSPDGGTQAEAAFAAPASAPVEYKHAYKARPLNGIWATAPYLHNGSVRTLYQLLLPASQRDRTFKLGSHELDPVEVGYKNEGDFTFDTTSQPGNSNAGHEYGKDLSKLEREQLVEYLKSL